MAEKRGARTPRLLRRARQHRCGRDLPHPGRAALVQGAAAPQPAHTPELDTDGPHHETMATTRPHHGIPYRPCASTPEPEAGAQCGNPARWDLCGGPPVRAVPTAISPQQVKLVLSGDSSHTVTLTNLKAHIIEKSDPINGTLWFAPGEGADANVMVGTHLDSTDLKVHDLKGDGFAQLNPVGAAGRTYAQSLFAELPYMVGVLVRRDLHLTEDQWDGLVATCFALDVAGPGEYRVPSRSTSSPPRRTGQAERPPGCVRTAGVPATRSTATPR